MFVYSQGRKCVTVQRLLLPPPIIGRVFRPLLNHSLAYVSERNARLLLVRVRAQVVNGTNTYRSKAYRYR